MGQSCKRTAHDPHINMTQLGSLGSHKTRLSCQNASEQAVYRYPGNTRRDTDPRVQSDLEKSCLEKTCTTSSSLAPGADSSRPAGASSRVPSGVKLSRRQNVCSVSSWNRRHDWRRRKRAVGQSGPGAGGGVRAIGYTLATLVIRYSEGNAKDSHANRCSITGSVP